MAISTVYGCSATFAVGWFFSALLLQAGEGSVGILGTVGGDVFQSAQRVVEQQKMNAFTFQAPLS